MTRGSGRPVGGRAAATVRIEVPGAVRELVAKLEEAGFETWTVGGGVRDAVWGRRRAPEDWDLATRATPGEVRGIFRRTVPLGERHGTIGVFGTDNRLYEVTTFRRDISTDGRRAVVAFASSIDEDLARRDFTVNAMAWHPLRKALVDPHGGREDLARGILRAVGDARLRFTEDRLRVLRGLRFAGSLGLEIEARSWAALVEAVAGLGLLSAERVREEIVKVLGGPRPSRALGLYLTAGVVEKLLPELEGGIGDAALVTTDALEGREPELPRLAALLLHGMGPAPDPDRAAALLRRLRFSKAEVRRVCAVVESGLAPPTGLRDDLARRRWMAAAVRSSPTALSDAFRVWRAHSQAVAAQRRRGVQPAIAAIQRDLDAGIPMRTEELDISGTVLLAHGWQPGPALGAALARLLELVWIDPSLNTRSALLEMADGLDPDTLPAASTGERG